MDGESSGRTNAGMTAALRILLLSVLAAAVAGLVVDRRARSASNDALTRIQPMVAADESPTEEVVKAELDRDPAEVFEASDGRIVEVFKWQGALRSYDLYLYINRGPVHYVSGVTLNQVLPGVELTSVEARPE